MDDASTLRGAGRGDLAGVRGGGARLGPARRAPRDAGAAAGGDAGSTLSQSNRCAPGDPSVRNHSTISDHR